MSGAALMSKHTCCHHLLMSMGKPSWLSARLAPPAGALRNMRMLELLQMSMH